MVAVQVPSPTVYGLRYPHPNLTELFMTYYIAQAVGIVGMALSILSFQCRENKRFFLTQAASGAMFAVNFLMLGSYTAAVLNFINIFRGWVFGFAPKKLRTPLAVSIGAAYILSTVLTYDGWLSLLVLAAQLVGTTVMWTDSGKIIRVAQLAFVSPSWLTHNIICGSLGAILCEVFAITSTVISLVRFRRDGFAAAGDKR